MEDYPVVHPVAPDVDRANQPCGSGGATRTDGRIPVASGRAPVRFGTTASNRGPGPSSSGWSIEGITPHPPSGFGQTAEVVDIGSPAPWSDFPVDPTSDAMSRDRLVEVLPGVYKVVADLHRLFNRAVEFLWESGSDDEPASPDRETRRADFQPMGVTIHHRADVGPDLDESNKYFEDGYRPRIDFRADGEPVELVVMA